jgi:PAS domain S-box-containing protein
MLPRFPVPSTAAPIDSNSLFESAFQHAAIGMALLSPEGRWLRVNQSLCELTGYTRDELLKITFQDITHPDDLNLDLANVEKLLAGTIRNYQMEKRYFHKDGSIIWVMLSVSLVRNDGGLPLFFISQISDITARKAAEHRLREADTEIDRLRKGLVTVCAWTKRIEVNGTWLTVDEFLTQHLDLKLTHGISQDAAKLFGPE